MCTVRFTGFKINQFFKLNFHVGMTNKFEICCKFKTQNSILSSSNIKIVFFVVAQPVYTSGICF